MHFFHSIQSRSNCVHTNLLHLTVLTMDQKMKAHTLQYDPIVEELVNLSNEVDDEKLKKRVEAIIDLRYQRDVYGTEFNTPASPALQEILHSTLTENWDSLLQNHELTNRCSPHMVSGLWAGQILKILVSMQSARRVLEIGMFTGYGALSMAEALPQDGELVTCDMQPYLEKMARKHFDKSPHGKKITIKIAPALETMAELAKEGKQFDLVFVDADKAGYIGYFKFILDNNLLAPRGTIAFDNVYWSGNPYIVEPGKYEVMREFNNCIKNDPRVYQVLLPVRDGIALVRRKEDVEYNN